MHHREKHPEPVEGCYPCKLLGVHVSGSAMPTRYKGGYYKNDPKQWDRDLEAFRNARAQGVTPEKSTEKSAKEALRKAGSYESARA